MNILHIHASPRIEGSHSHQLAQAFFEKLESTGKSFEIDTLNLWEENIPAVDERFLSAKEKAASGDDLANGDRVIWSQAENLIARIKSADAILWSVPMWNFGSPYVVKQFIDVVTQYGYLFTVTESGYSGLLEDKPTLLALSRGGSYSKGSGAEVYDHQEPYLRAILGFWGIQSISVAYSEATMGEPEAKAASFAKGLEAVHTFAEQISA
ncbi:MAG: NAD(P)H-dependent oxidoreductase [Verrucomicrobiota bacterium]